MAAVECHAMRALQVLGRPNRRGTLVRAQGADTRSQAASGRPSAAACRRRRRVARPSRRPIVAVTTRGVEGASRATLSSASAPRPCVAPVRVIVIIASNVSHTQTMRAGSGKPPRLPAGREPSRPSACGHDWMIMPTWASRRPTCGASSLSSIVCLPMTAAPRRRGGGLVDERVGDADPPTWQDRCGRVSRRSSMRSLQMVGRLGFTADSTPRVLAGEGVVGLDDVAEQERGCPRRPGPARSGLPDPGLGDPLAMRRSSTISGKPLSKAAAEPPSR